LKTYYNPTYTAHVNLTISSDPGEPKTIKEALLGPEKKLWKEAIKKEVPNLCPGECGNQCQGKWYQSK
jgi:hypothetical protein